MLILSIDSSATAASVALTEEDKLVGEFFVNTSLIAATDVSVDMLKPYIIVTNTNKLGLYSSDLRIENVDGIVINSTATVKYEITNKDGA